jgi:quinol monooxygenase YgiN
MYGTVARMKIKPGQMERFLEVARRDEPQDPSAGLVASYVYRMDSDPNELLLAVVFRDKESYRRNAESPDQDKAYREWLEHLDGEPEWHDGEVVYESTSR